MGTRLADLTPIALQVQNDGVALPREPGLNFVGAGVTASHDAANDRINVTIPGGGGGGGYDTIEEEGVAVAQETVMNFVGPLITATPGTGKTTITAPKIIWNQTIIADGSNGDLPIFDDDGDAFLLNIGTLGQVLKVAGTGQAAWEDESGGGGITREFVANPFTDHYLYDEFYYPTASGLDLHYVRNGTFSVPSQKVSGQVTFTVPTTNNITHIRTCGGGLAAIEADKKFRFVVRAQMNSNTLHAQLINLFVDGGQLPAGSLPFTTNPTPHIQFLQNSGGNWFARTDNGVTPNSTDTGVAADTAMHTFEIVSDPSVPNIVFKIDDVIVATFTTNLPVGLMTMYIANQNGEASSKTMEVDTMFLFNERA